MKRWKLTAWGAALLVGCASGADPEAASATDVSSGDEVAPAATVSETPNKAAARKADGASVQAKRGEQAMDYDYPPRSCRLELDYNRCIVERLEGRADTEDTLVPLIQSQLILGDRDGARRNMDRYIDRFPDSLQSDNYRAYLDRY